MLYKLDIAETIKIAQSKNDKEAIIYAMLWLSFILGELGFGEMQKTMLQHILIDAHEQKQSHLFALAAYNFASLEYSFKPTLELEIIPFKLTSKLGLAESNNPLWEQLLTLASQKEIAVKSDPSQDQSMGAFVRPANMFIKAFNYSIHGIDSYFQSAFRILYSLYKPHLNNPRVHSSLLLASLKVNQSLTL